MGKVFISYSRKDEEFVSRLVLDLEREGLDVFYYRKLKPGENYDDVLSHELEEAKYVLVVLSPDSIESPRVLKELDTGLRRERQRQTTVIPLLFRPCKAERINEILGSKHYADFTKGYRAGFEELSSVLLESRNSPQTGITPPPSPGPRKRRSLSLGQGIGAAVITAVVALVTGYWQFVYKPTAPETRETVTFTGRVMDDNHREQVIKEAKISVETEGAPQLYYTDAEGIFLLKLNRANDVRIRVSREGYQEQSLLVSPLRTGVQDIFLSPNQSPSPTPTTTRTPLPHPDVAAYISKCQRYYTQGQYDAALVECNQAVHTDPGNQAARKLRNQVQQTINVLKRPG